MSEENRSAIAGAVHSLRVLADGTVAVVLHFEPKNRVEAMTMMGAPGTPIACVRLADGFAAAPAAPKASYRDLGPICREAIDLCGNERFLEYIGRPSMGGPKWRPTPDAAKGYILSVCNVNSRKELDTAEGARDLFIEHVRKPFLAWAAKNG